MSGQRRALVRALVAVGLCGPIATLLAQDPRASTVANAARDWLALTDRGDAATSHARAAAKFRQAMDVPSWNKALAEVRAPRGAVTQRTVVRTTFEKSFPGLPAGDYALLLYRTAFAKQVDSEESVTLEREADGAWRVVGYVIR